MTAHALGLAAVCSLVACAACSSNDSPPAAQAMNGTSGQAGTVSHGGASGAGASGASGVTSGGASGAGGVGAATGAGSGGASANGGTTNSAGMSGSTSQGGAGSGGMSENGGRGGRGGRGGAGASSGGASSGGMPNGGASNGGMAGTAAGSAGAGAGGGAGAPAGWTLTWSDEFDGASGQSPDSSKWVFDVGGDGWGNNELEYYTDRPENSATDGEGHLVITLKSETFMNRSYTSARLKTQGKFTQALGRFEARIKAPVGQGVWPAFWMLGEDITTNVWPNCGEIDIMEIAGKAPTVNHGSLHGPGYSGGSPLTATYTLMGGGKLTDDFHVYRVEWETNTVRWYVDETNYSTKKNTDVPNGAEWVYDHPFFMLLNVAIGGSFGGTPDSTTMLPQTMTIDYVRVYEKS